MWGRLIRVEIERLAPVIAHLQARGALVSVDTFRPEVQTYALLRGVAFLNDIHGFPHATMYPALAASSCRLIAMHSLHGPNHITRADIPVPDVMLHPAISRPFGTDARQGDAPVREVVA